LNRQFGLTTVIVSHDTSIAQHVDRVVAIRDGKTSSETVRQSATDSTHPETGEAFDEVVLLDSAGRLQVPQRIPGTVQHPRARPSRNGGRWYLIRPVENNAQGLVAQADEAALETNPIGANGLRGWWQRWRGSGRGSQ